MKRLYSCQCGGFKFYCNYSRAECAVCGKIVPYPVAAGWVYVPRISKEASKCVKNT